MDGVHHAEHGELLKGRPGMEDDREYRIHEQRFADEWKKWDVPGVMLARQCDAASPESRDR